MTEEEKYELLYALDEAKDCYQHWSFMEQDAMEMRQTYQNEIAEIELKLEAQTHEST